MYRLSLLITLFCATLQAGPTLSQQLQHAHSHFSHLADRAEILPTTLDGTESAVAQHLITYQQGILAIQNKLLEGDLPAEQQAALTTFLRQLQQSLIDAGKKLMKYTTPFLMLMCLYLFPQQATPPTRSSSPIDKPVTEEKE